jgi:hypothetical protein
VSDAPYKVVITDPYGHTWEWYTVPWDHADAVFHSLGKPDFTDIGERVQPGHGGMNPE